MEGLGFRASANYANSTTANLLAPATSPVRSFGFTDEDIQMRTIPVGMSQALANRSKRDRRAITQGLPTK